jgi:thiamine-phosphate pyrophosphorylase
MDIKDTLRLYLVTTDFCNGDPDKLIRTVEWAVQGGVSAVQLRMKQSSDKQFYTMALTFKQLLTHYHVPLIINDRVDIALAVAADGLHLGQSDLPCRVARRLMGNQRIIGLSVENLQQVEIANTFELDYVAASPVFETATKQDTAASLGMEGLKRVRANSKHPVIAIGGIQLHNVSQVMEVGADGVSVVSAIMDAVDPKEAAMLFRERINRKPYETN